MPYYRRNIYIVSFTVLLAAASWNLVMPFLAPFIQGMGVAKGQLPYWIGLAFGLQSAASMVVQPFWGKMGDSKGRKVMIVRAGICLAGVYYGMSMCRTPLQIVILRVLNGALTGFMPGSYALLATNTPREEAPRAVATAQAAGSAGLIVGPAIGACLAGPLGYRGTMQVSGTAVLVATLLVAMLVQEPNKTVQEEPTSLLQDFRLALRSPVQLSLMFAVFLSWTFGQSIAPYLVLHVSSLVGAASHSWMVGLVYALPSVAFVLAAHRWTCFGERWGYEKGILVGLAGGGIGTLFLPLAHNVWAFAGAYFATGLLLAALSPSISAITCTKVHEVFRGRAYAIQQSAGTLGGLIAPLASARLVAGYGIPAVFVFVGGIFLAGSLVFNGLLGRWRSNGGGPDDPLLDPTATGG